MPLSTRNRLQDQLDLITANTRELVQPERLAVTDNAVHDLLSTGIESAILPVGSPAPAFELKDARGKTVRSTDLLSLGPLIVKFFRGRWCPYCMTELEALQALYPQLRERGALLVAISPQLVRQNDFTVQRHGLSFPILSDPGAVLATQFGIAYTVPEPLRLHYRSILINIPFINGDQSWRLPLAATFVIKPTDVSSRPSPPILSSRPSAASGETRSDGATESHGTIAFAEAHADHRVRPDPMDVLAVL
jgi:peroxiredoxin